MKRLLMAVALVTATTGSAFASDPITDFFDHIGRNIHQVINHRRHHEYQGNTVLASYYGHGEKLNGRTATGERFNPNGLTAAHRTLPLGSLVRVEANGHSIVVRINDRGPAAYTGRNIDLSYGAARALGIANRGVAKVYISRP